MCLWGPDDSDVPTPSGVDKRKRVLEIRDFADDIEKKILKEDESQCLSHTPMLQICYLVEAVKIK